MNTSKLGSKFLSGALVAAGSLLSAGQALAGVVFICHPATSLSEADVKAALQGERPTIKVVDNAAVKNDMLTWLGITDKRYASVWQIKSFREGASIPPVKTSDSEVVDFVKNTAGGLGYVASKPGDSGVHTCF